MIQKLKKTIFSMRVAGFGLLLLAVILGFATFIESANGVETAKVLVYGSKWFELLLLFLSVAMTVIYFQFKLYKKEKMTIGLFHLSFILIIIGAGVTRYFGEEGNIHIREGETSSDLISSDEYFHVTISDGKQTFAADQNVLFTPYSKSEVSINVDVENKSFKIRSVDLIAVQNDSEAPASMGHRSSARAAKIKISDDIKTDYANVIIGDGGESASSKVKFGDFDLEMWIGPKIVKLPFAIKLNDFQLIRYPGSMSPSSYESYVTLIDQEQGVNRDFKIYMNNILKHRGYRFYQSSFDQDEKGTILSVNKDLPGTWLTYIGYGLLFLAIILSIFNRKSYFYKLMVKASKPVAAILFVALFAFSHDSKGAEVSKQAASEFAKIWVQGHDGRVKPMSTLAYEAVMKMSREESLNGLSPEQAVLSMIAYPDEWQKVPMITVSESQIRSLLGISGSKAALADFFDEKGNYKLMKVVGDAFAKQPSQRNTFDNGVIKVDDRLNVAYMVYKGELLSIFPSTDKTNTKWEDPTKAAASTGGSMMAKVYMDYMNAVQSNDFQRQKSDLLLIKQYQEKCGAELIPGDTKRAVEILYNQVNVFKNLSYLYLLAGLALLGFFFRALLTTGIMNPKVSKYTGYLFIVGFLLHTIGLIARGYIAGHMPWSDGYESMIYIAWTGMLAGLIFARTNPMVLGAAALLSGLTLFVAQMSWLNPEITNLVPVLKSYWLTIHVAVITGSYGFLGVSAIIGLLNLILAGLVHKHSKDRIQRNIRHMTWINEASMILGLYLLTIGTFLGAIWANESWGRYWGWDPKETWSLVTILVYAFITHMRLIPGFRGWYAVNLASVAGLLSVLMTYLGVNYYLTGLHSYGSGDAVAFPLALVVVIVIIGFIAYRAWNNLSKITLPNE